MPADPVAICHRCPHRGPLQGRVIVCTVSGRPILDHANPDAYDCPKGLYPSRGAGDDVKRALDATRVGWLAKKIIEAATGKPCGCEERRRLLNQARPRG